MSYSLNSLKGVYIGDYMLGINTGVIQREARVQGLLRVTRNIDYSSSKASVGNCAAERSQA